MGFQLSRTKIEMILVKVGQEGNSGIGISGLMWRKNLREFFLNFGESNSEEFLLIHLLDKMSYNVIN